MVYTENKFPMKTGFITSMYAVHAGFEPATFGKIQT